VDPEENQNQGENLEKRLDEVADEFQLRILEAALKGDEDNFDVLFELGNAYTRAGRYEDGLQVDQKLTSLQPANPIAHYNFSCSLSLLGRVDEALDELEQSFRLGYREFNHILSDPDLENLHGDRRFSDLIERYLRGDRQSD
jgi:tetratricopeptide (TPR) repeat protein